MTSHSIGYVFGKYGKNKTCAMIFSERLYKGEETWKKTCLVGFCVMEKMEENGKMVIPKNITFVEMSKYLGIHPVTISRIFARLCREGDIDK